jgi:hypothetical protein
MTARRVSVVPHTHWDREWYEPFQTFRLRLVELLDALLDLLDSDPSYARYLLDGQMAVVDDYLEVRPENEDRLRRLGASGRVSMGPWYILMDEFLVSGETIVRNLQLGMERGAAFGGVSTVAYLPDMFGHIAQMPQILRLAGFEDTAVWRGVPSEITQSAFMWRAPDGSEVRAEYLLDGYGNGASLPDDAKAVVGRLRDHAEEFSTFLEGDILLMNGSDHQLPQPFLGRVLAEANSIQDDFEFRISSLADHLEAAPRDGLQTWSGELRSGFRANVLMGVASNRVDVKRAAMVTECALERRAEPLAAMFVPPGEWPGSLLAIAWREVIRNSAHDSICACSVDEVVDAVLHRFHEARAIADGLAERALQRLGASMANGGYVVANASRRQRSGVVEVVVAGDEVDPQRLQVVSERGALPGEMVIDSHTARTLVSMIQGPRIDDDAWIEEISVTEDDDEIVLTVAIGPFERPDAQLEMAREALLGKLGARPGVPVRVRLDQVPIRRVLGRTEQVQGFGWRRFTPAPLEHPAAPQEAGGRVVLGNGLVTVEIDPGAGTFSIDGHEGFGRLVDEGDLGDSYNYSPPAQDAVIDSPVEVHVRITEHGPVRAAAEITSLYDWPNHVDGSSQKRVGTNRVEVTTVVRVLADERAVRVETSFTNPSRDHRLRVHMPTIDPASTSEAECAFGTVTRGLTAEGRPDEFGLPTFPSRRFVRAGRVTVVHVGLNEYELTGITESGATELAITLLRSTGMLSRLGMAYRPLPAGPMTPVEGLQLVGHRITSTYAVAIDAEDPWSLCDDVLLPLEVATSAGGGARKDDGASLTVDGAEVSSLRIVDGLTEIRIFNPGDHETLVRVPGRRGWEIDLRGRAVSSFEGSITLRGRGIATLRLSGAVD